MKLQSLISVPFRVSRIRSLFLLLCLIPFGGHAWAQSSNGSRGGVTVQNNGSAVGTVTGNTLLNFTSGCTPSYVAGGFNIACSGSSTSTSVAAAQYCVDTGAVNTLTCAPASPITSYAAGQSFIVKVAHTNTNSVTLAVSGLTAQNVTEQGNNLVAFTGGELFINNYYQFTYDGAQFRVGAPIIAEPCSWAPGATLDQQIANVLAATSTSKAVIIDCRDISGTPTIAANPFASLFSTGYAPTTQGVLFLPCLPITQTAPIVLTSGWTVNGCSTQIGSNGGTKLIASTGFQSTYTIGTILSWTCAAGPPQTCTVIGSGTNWTAGNVKLYSEFTLCSVVGGNGSNCSTNDTTNALAGMISAINSTTSITVQLTGTLPSNASTLADSYVINACMICMGDESSNGANPFNFAVQIGSLTLNCGAILGCEGLANFSCSNLCGFDGPVNISPSNNVGVILEGNQGQNAAFNTYTPWISCAGHCTSTTVGLIVRSGIASPLGLNGWQVAVGFVSGATGVVDDSPVWLYDFHVLGSGSGDAVAVGTGNVFVCPTICRMQPQNINGGGVMNLNCPPGSAGTTNCLHFGTNGTPTNYSAIGIKALGSGITNTLKDDNANPSACTITVAAEPAVQQYVVGATSGVRISSSAQTGCQSAFPTLTLGAGSTTAPSLQTAGMASNTGWYSPNTADWCWDSAGVIAQCFVSSAFGLGDGQGLYWSETASANGTVGAKVGILGSGATEMFDITGGTSTGAINTGNKCTFVLTTSSFTLALSPVTLCPNWSLPQVSKSFFWQCSMGWSNPAGTTPTFAIGITWAQAPSSANQLANIYITNGSGTVAGINDQLATSTTTNSNILATPSLTNSGTVFQAFASGEFVSSATAGAFSPTVSLTGTGATGTAAGGCTYW